MKKIISIITTLSILAVLIFTGNSYAAALDAVNVETSKNTVRPGEEVDVKVKCIENETTQAQLAGDIGTTKSYVNRIIKKQEGVVNKTFVQMMEALGYDIELTYVKREKC